jgi:hypothetical protein
MESRAVERRPKWRVLGDHWQTSNPLDHPVAQPHGWRAKAKFAMSVAPRDSGARDSHFIKSGVLELCRRRQFTGCYGTRYVKLGCW